MRSPPDLRAAAEPHAADSAAERRQALVPEPPRQKKVAANLHPTSTKKHILCSPVFPQRHHRRDDVPVAQSIGEDLPGRFPMPLMPLLTRNSDLSSAAPPGSRSLSPAGPSLHPPLVRVRDLPIILI